MMSVAWCLFLRLWLEIPRWLLHIPNKGPCKNWKHGHVLFTAILCHSHSCFSQELKRRWRSIFVHQTGRPFYFLVRMFFVWSAMGMQNPRTLRETAGLKLFFVMHAVQSFTPLFHRKRGCSTGTCFAQPISCSCKWIQSLCRTIGIAFCHLIMQKQEFQKQLLEKQDLSRLRVCMNMYL